jgi:electron transport complex protein RnfD
MKFQVGNAPHLPPQSTVASIMMQVIFALIPAIVAHWWFFGWGIVFQLILAVGFALLFEWLMLRARGKPVALFMRDYSAVVTGILFALCIPPTAPWWISLIAMLFAIVIAKHLYGGLGHNLFNPAMAGYVVVLISFPAQMTLWLPPEALADSSMGIIETLTTIFSGSPPGGVAWDAVTQATPLDTIKTGVHAEKLISEIRVTPIFGSFGGYGWEWIANWYLAGGLFLLFRRIISWHVPLAVVGTVFILGTVGYLLDQGGTPAPVFQLYSGGIMLGAFFIATDPVSGCVSRRGKIIFGIGVAVLTLIIRRWGGYPDGFAFAVLLMNVAAPFINIYTQPRTYGHNLD